MGFTVVSERVEYKGLDYERKIHVLAEIRKNHQISELLDDLGAGLPIGDHYSEDTILTEVAKLRENADIDEDVTVGEAYSALLMEMEDKVEELCGHLENVKLFKEAFKNLDEVDISDD